MKWRYPYRFELKNFWIGIRRSLNLNENFKLILFLCTHLTHSLFTLLLLSFSLFFCFSILFTIYVTLINWFIQWIDLLIDFSLTACFHAREFTYLNVCVIKNSICLIHLIYSQALKSFDSVFVCYRCHILTFVWIDNGYRWIW